MICLRCGKVEEFFGEPLQRLRKQIESHFGFQVLLARTEVGGDCAHCQTLRAREVEELRTLTLSTEKAGAEKAAAPARPFDKYTLPVVGLVSLGLGGLFAGAAGFAMFPELIKGNAFLEHSAAAAGALMPIVWFSAKVIAILFVYIWVRGTLPRFRYDQLMSFAWTFLFPVALINLFLVALWVALN